MLRRADGDRSHFLTISLWDSLESIKRFAGDDYERARYYAEDDKFLLEFEPTVQHYEYYTNAKNDPAYHTQTGAKRRCQ